MLYVILYVYFISYLAYLVGSFHIAFIYCLLFYRMALVLRNMLRGVARRVQVRSYADAPKEGEMALTFAAGNKVLMLNKFIN